MARNEPQVNLRVPSELKDRLDQAAETNKRSLTAEIVARLETTFENVDPAEKVWAKVYPSITLTRGELDQLGHEFGEIAKDFQRSRMQHGNNELREDLEYTMELLAIMQRKLDPTPERAEELGLMAGRRYLRWPSGGLADNPFPANDVRHRRFVEGFRQSAGVTGR